MPTENKDSELALKLIDQIDEYMVKASNSLFPVFQIPHEKIENFNKENDEIKKYIKDEFNKNEVCSVHLTWIFELIDTQLVCLESMILLEINRQGPHEKGLNQILTLVNNFDKSTVSNFKDWGPYLVNTTHSQKIKDISIKITEHFNNYHTVMAILKYSIEKAIKIEAKIIKNIAENN